MSENKKMKVGILTFWRAHNNGALLQAWALKHYLAKQGVDAEILPYCYGKREEPSDLHTELCKKDLVLPWRWKIALHKLRKYLLAKNSWEMRCQKFDDFILENVSVKLGDEMSLEELSNYSADTFITGSDQVWSSWIYGKCDPAFFLDFETTAKKISYAPSMTSSGNHDLIPESEREYFKKALAQLDCVSAREEGLAKQLEDLLQHIVAVTLDPTLLLDKEDYLGFIKPIRLPKRYVFVHYLYEDLILEECAKLVAEQLNCEIVELHFRQEERFIHRSYCFANFGPEEFLSALSRSEFVLCNSFHTTVFSILFQKQFYSIYGQDSRKNALLVSLGLSDRHLTKKEDVSKSVEIIDFERVMCRVRELRKGSEAYLENALGLNENVILKEKSDD